jgi:hypothetical protein
VVVGDEDVLCFSYMINATMNKIRYKVDAKAKESQMRIDI